MEIVRRRTLAGLLDGVGGRPAPATSYGSFRPRPEFWGIFTAVRALRPVWLPLEESGRRTRSWIPKPACLVTGAADPPPPDGRLPACVETTYIQLWQVPIISATAHGGPRCSAGSLWKTTSRKWTKPGAMKLGSGPPARPSGLVSPWGLAFLATVCRRRRPVPGAATGHVAPEGGPGWWPLQPAWPGPTVLATAVAVFRVGLSSFSAPTPDALVAICGGHGNGSAWPQGGDEAS